MRTELPSRFIGFRSIHALDPSALIAALCHERDEQLAVEIDAHAFASPSAAQVVDAATGLGVEVTARLRHGCSLDRLTIALMRARSCDSVAIEIDGHDAITHDGYHGHAGSFASSLKSLEQAKHLGFGIYVISRIHRADADHLSRMATLPRWLGAKAWFVSFGAARAAGGSHVQLSLEERCQACATLDGLAEQHRQAIAVRCPECGSAGWFDSDACVDPAEIATASCVRGCASSASDVNEAAQHLAEATT